MKRVLPPSTPPVVNPKGSFAGEVESYDSVDAFVSQISSEHRDPSPPHQRLQRRPDALVADGTAVNIPLNPALLEGNMWLFRPFSGVAVHQMEFVAKDPDELHKISQIAFVDQREILIRLFHKGKIQYRFGDQYYASDEVAGLVTYSSSPGSFDFQIDRDQVFGVTMIAITEEGEREIWNRLGIPPIPCFQDLREGKLPAPGVLVIPKSEQFYHFSSSLVLTPKSGFVQAAALRLKLGELICLLSDVVPSIQVPRAPAVPFGEVRKLQQARAILDESLSDPPEVKRLGLLVGLNRRKLTQGFKEVFGRTVAEYLREQQMRLGYHLLKESSLSIEEVSIECGYGYPHNFTSAFKRRYGCSPTEIRRLK